ncbi:MAG: iron export ABC transporter permease subunit FetB [Candidatus Brocadiaceae bacterium]|nr:iron export ABC transporter permease subunit FetB [Candidatus Brocadiaceae bacterium]
MNTVVDISWVRLGLGILFIIILLSISLYETLQLEKSILTGTLRASLQLILVGYLINVIFNHKEWYFVLLILMIMLLVASRTLIKRLKNPIRGTYVYALVAVSLASLLSLILIFKVIIAIPVWYEPQYLIPIAGMIIAGGMNGAALAGERYRSEMELRLPEMEMLLSLGYESRKASRRPRQQALTAALIPSLNNMMVMGIVHLPGMMTGQIVAGSNPVTAVKYQIVIVLSLAATVSLASWIFLSLLDKKFFTPNHQIRYELIRTRRL